MIKWIQFLRNLPELRKMLYNHYWIVSTPEQETMVLYCLHLTGECAGHLETKTLKARAHSIHIPGSRKSTYGTLPDGTWGLISQENL